MTRVSVVLVVCVGAYGCGPQTAPLVRPAPPPLVIRENLPDDAQLCVVLDPWHYTATFACLDLGTIRRTIRGQAVARVEVTP